MTDDAIKWRDELLDDVEKLLASFAKVDAWNAPIGAAMTMKTQAESALYEVRRRRHSGITDILRGRREQEGLDAGLPGA